MSRTISYRLLRCVAILIIHDAVTTPSYAQSNYTAQAANFTVQTQDNNNPPFSGAYNASGTSLGLYANGGVGGVGSNPQAVAFRTFTTDGTNISSTAQSLQVGQSFSVTLNLSGNQGINGNSIGFSLRSGTASSGVSNYNSGSRFEYSFSAGDSTAAIYADTGKQTANLPNFSDFSGGLTYTFTLVSTNEFNFTVSGGGATYNVGKLAGTSSAAIDSFSLFNRGYDNSNAIYSGLNVANVGTITYTANTAETKAISGVIKDLTTGSNAIQKLGAGTVSLQNANTFSGVTTVTAGILSLDAAGALGGGQSSHTSNITVGTSGTLLLGGSAGIDRIHDATPISLGGAFNSAGFSERVGALTLAATSSIDLGAGTSTLIFGGTSVRTGGTLAITNWTSGSDHVLFYDAATGTTAYMLDSTFLSNITINGFGVNELPSGEIVPVPEPATWCAGFLTLGAASFGLRRLRRAA